MTFYKIKQINDVKLGLILVKDNVAPNILFEWHFSLANGADTGNSNLSSLIKAIKKIILIFLFLQIVMHFLCLLLIRALP